MNDSAENGKKDRAPRIVVIGASAGGVESITYLASQFPPDIDAAVFVVLHLPHNATSYMPQILTRAGDLKAVHPEADAPVTKGMIYVAPPDKHLLVRDGRVVTVSGPRENGHRPAIDPLFRSAAESYNENVIGIILSGNLDDGTAGLAAVKSRGGVAIVQNPDETLFRGMPTSAIENVNVDHVLPLERIVPTILKLIDEGAPTKEAFVEKKNDDLEIEVRNAELDPSLSESDNQPGEPSGFSCPECNGGLWEVVEGKLVRYRCRVGHAYSAESLLSASGSAVEAALWAALRALEENSAFSRRLARRAHSLEQRRSADRFLGQAKKAAEHAVVLRRILLDGRIHAEPSVDQLVAPES
jgi:two-component system, chemotaxis family, protein-glutamate methylesterase/glutaminase